MIIWIKLEVVDWNITSWTKNLYNNAIESWKVEVRRRSNNLVVKYLKDKMTNILMVKFLDGRVIEWSEELMFRNLEDHIISLSDDQIIELPDHQIIRSSADWMIAWVHDQLIKWSNDETTITYFVKFNLCLVYEMHKANKILLPANVSILDGKC